LEPQSGWVPPIGVAGGGSDAKGFYFVPEIGANIAVVFLLGDVDHPRYLVGQWGTGEAPSFARGLSASDAVKVAGIQSSRWEIVLDDRPGMESVRIKDLRFDDVVEIDGAGHGVHIKGTAAVVIESTGVVSITALQIVLNGRVVRPSGEPI
jgi:uncharacterized protein involved in type VI secretion and phage assembly